MNYVPFAEKVIEMVTDLYKATASHTAVIEEHVLQHIIKVQLPLEPEFTYAKGSFTLIVGVNAAITLNFHINLGCNPFWKDSLGALTNL